MEKALSAYKYLHTILYRGKVIYKIIVGSLQILNDSYIGEF